MLSKLIIQLRKRNIPIMEGDGPLGEPRNRKVRVDGVGLLSYCGMNCPPGGEIISLYWLVIALRLDLSASP